MDKIVTIAIPTYNMGKYLGRCLDSLLIKDSSLLSLVEILVINDGSSDNSLEIACKYEALFPNIIRVIDKPNGNYGSCLNVAFQEAKGTYFRTLDADDWFDTDAFSSYIKKLTALKDKAELILTAYSVESGKSIFHRPQGEDSRICSWSKVDFQALHYCIHSATYLTEIVRNIKLQEHICYTDIEVCLYALPHIKSYTVFNICLYKYWIGREGQSVDMASYRKNVKHMYKIIAKYLESDSNNPISVQIYQYKVISSLIRFYYFVCLIYPISYSDKYDFQRIDRLLSFHWPKLYKIVLQLKFYHIPFIKCWKSMPAWEFYLLSLLMKIGSHLLYRRRYILKKVKATWLNFMNA